jgi:hypothetical protein
MSIIRRATETQLTFLRNSGASFKVILADGEVVVHDPNNLIEPKQREKKRVPTRNPDVKRGEPTAWGMELLKDLQPGQTVNLPHKYHPDTVQSIACNVARRLWGSNNYVSEQKPGADYVTILRIN